MKKLKLMTIVGTRPEIIRLAATIKCADKYFEQILVHTGQNYDYNLNQVFFEDLGLRKPNFYLNAVGKNLGETIGNIIAKSYELMVQEKPDALLILGDTIPVCLQSQQNDCIFLFFIWKLEIVALMNVFLRKPIEELLITSLI